MSENAQELWQVEAAGKIYDTHFDEMTAWIAEGSLLRIDRVRKANLRWIEAGKVPSLIPFFNAKDASTPSGPVISMTNVEVLGVAQSPEKLTNKANAENPTFGNSNNVQSSSTSDGCVVHAGVTAVFVCETCTNLFCRSCPNSYGPTVKICPMCGAMCRSIEQVEKKRVETEVRHRTTIEGFGFGDFIAAFAYPFKFTTSLIIGAVMFAVISLGQSAGALGGIFMFAAALICYLIANMLTFGVLANTIDNFSQGKLDANFMPSFEDFSIWDDIVHPFFLSIGVYVTSFGPLIALVLVTAFIVMNAVTSEMNGLQSDAARIARPDMTYAANAMKQSEKMRDLYLKNAEEQQRRVAEFENADPPNGAPNSSVTNTNIPAYEQDTEAMVAEANEMINQHKKAQLESVVGKTPETIAGEREAMISKILDYGALFLILGGVFLLWGLFYFPAACAVAGYTRSFLATLNPTVGLDTIKRLGFDYVKILAMCLVLIVFSAIIGGIISAALIAFDMPGVGNLPAKFIGSLFTFYFSVVFSCVLGFAIYKASDRLKLYQS